MLSEMSVHACLSPRTPEKDSLSKINAAFRSIGIKRRSNQRTTFGDTCDGYSSYHAGKKVNTMPMTKTPIPCDVVLAASLCDRVSAIDTQIRTCNVLTGVAGQERDCAHQVFWNTHLADGDQACPLLGEGRVVVEDLLGAVFALAKMGGQ